MMKLAAWGFVLLAVMMPFVIWPASAQVRSGGDDMWPQWSPDSQYIAFNSNRDGNQEVYVTDALGGSVRNVTNISSNEFLVGWLPDSQRLAFISGRAESYRIFTVNKSGSDARALFTDTGSYGSLTWSPDGRYVAFRLADMQYVMEVEGGEVGQLSGNGSVSAGAGTDWSPDGQWLAFHGYNTAAKEELIHVVRVDGSNLQTFPVLTGQCCRMEWAWSPDSREIAYGVSSVPDLYAINIATGATRLIAHVGYVRGLQWLPDGETLVVLADANREGGLRAIYAVSAGEGSIRKIVEDDSWPLRLSPDGHYLALMGFQKDSVVTLVGTDGRVIRNYDLPYSNAFGTAWSPDGKRLAASLCVDNDADIYLILVDSEQVVNVTARDAFTGDGEVLEECRLRG